MTLQSNFVRRLPEGVQFLVCLTPSENGVLAEWKIRESVYQSSHTILSRTHQPLADLQVAIMHRRSKLRQTGSILPLSAPRACLGRALVGEAPASWDGLRKQMSSLCGRLLGCLHRVVCSVSRENQVWSQVDYKAASGPPSTREKKWVKRDPSRTIYTAPSKLHRFLLPCSQSPVYHRISSPRRLCASKRRAWEVPCSGQPARSWRARATSVGP